jgi:hypothetical protein
MKIADAEREIIREWHRWCARTLPDKEKPTGTDAFAFFGYLSSERSDLLNFKCSGDQWQRIHGWLLRRRYVSD